MAGLASAGKDGAGQLSVLAMETALLSLLVSVKLSMALAGKAGEGHGMEVGAGRGLRSESPFSSSTAWLSLSGAGSALEADIIQDYLNPTAFGSCEWK